MDEMLLTHGFVLRWLLFIDCIFDLIVRFILGLWLRFLVCSVGIGMNFGYFGLSYLHD